MNISKMVSDVLLPRIWIANIAQVGHMNSKRIPIRTGQLRSDAGRNFNTSKTLMELLHDTKRK